MSRKHNCAKRGQHARSHYRSRLEKRGLKTTPVMPGLDQLRETQERRARRTGQPWHTGQDDES